MSSKSEKCAIVIQWRKFIKAAAYPWPKDLPAHQKQAVATRLSRGQLNLTIQASKTKMLQSQELSLATGLEPSFMVRITRKRT